MRIRKVMTVEYRLLRVLIMCSVALFLFSVLCLLAAIIAEQELQHIQKRSSYPTRIESEVFDVASYRCKDSLDHIVVPRKGQIYTFACDNGNKYKDTVVISAIPYEQPIDYALD